MTTTLWRGARLVTLADARGWGLVERGALLVDGDTIAWAGAEADLPAALHADAEIDLGGALVTPGLVDCHTHLVYAGQRAGEFEQRLEGASYEDIARAGGGIRSTVAATRAASDETLVRPRPRARPGADARRRDDGRDQVGLRPRRRARGALPARRAPPRPRAAARRAHDLPRRRTRCRPSTPAAPTTTSTRSAPGCRRCTREGLVDAVDAFCDRIGFTPAQTRRVFDAARALGLPVKLHAEQLSDQHGAALAAEYGALSCDHLEYAGADGVAAMARGRHRRRAAARRVLLPARDAAAAGRRAARRRRADRDRHRPQPGLVADALAAADAEHGLHAVPPDARGSAARHDRRTRRARSASATAARSRPASAPTSSPGTSRIRTSSPTGSAAIRARASSSAASSARHERAGLHAASRHGAAPRQPAARRHRDPGRARGRARAARARARGHRLAPRPRSTPSRASSAPACSCRATRAT